LAQYREKAAFAQFGSDLDPATQKQLARGQRLVEVLKQGQYQPMPVERQVVILLAATRGYLDKQPVNKLREYEVQLAQYLDQKHPDLYKNLLSAGQFTDELKAKFEAAFKEFEGVFA